MRDLGMILRHTMKILGSMICVVLLISLSACTDVNDSEDISEGQAQYEQETGNESSVSPEYVIIQGTRFDRTDWVFHVDDMVLTDEDVVLLSYLRRAEVIHFHNSSAGDLSPLASLPSLEAITFNGNQISYLPQLSGLDRLSHVSLGNTRIRDLTPLADLPNLTILMIGNNAINDLSQLSGFYNLRQLSLSGCQISDVTSLSNLTNLTHLWLSNNKISDLSPLSGLTNLEHLGLDENQIRNIEPLSVLVNLNSLWLDNNQVSNIMPLSGLVNLVNLGLGNNQISDLTPLAGLSNLTGLRLDNNQITNVTPLSGLPELAFLSLRYNPIEDLSPVAHINLSINWIVERPEEFNLNRTQQILVEKSRYIGMLYEEVADLYGNIIYVWETEGGGFAGTTQEFDGNFSFTFGHGGAKCVGFFIRLDYLVPTFNAPFTWRQLAEEMGATLTFNNWGNGGENEIFGFVEWLSEYIQLNYADCEMRSRVHDVRMFVLMIDDAEDLAADTWVRIHSSIRQ